MLTKLIFKNFKSFKNETIIDFTRTKYETLENVNVADNNILKGVLFVGANASGKSNIIEAIRFLLDMLFLDREVKGLFPCLFSKEPEFSLDYYFTIENQEIRYRIRNNLFENIIYEDLWVNNELKLHRMGLMAESHIDANKKIILDEKDLNKESLSLRKIYFDSNRFAGNEILQKWYDFLKNSIYFNAFNDDIKAYSKIDFYPRSYIKEFGMERLNAFLDTHNFAYIIEYENEYPVGNRTVKLGGDNSKEIFFRRKGATIPIPLVAESLGNQTLLKLLPAFLHTIHNNSMLLIDEFSSGFHNELERLIVSYFMKNAYKSQMIFVSHSTNLLSTTLLRPDQIYAVDFNGENGSQVNRFSNEQPRFAQNLEKMYLSGVFDGLPTYKENDLED